MKIPGWYQFGMGEFLGWYRFGMREFQNNSSDIALLHDNYMVLLHNNDMVLLH
jgi:hypothetical protein